MALINPNVVPKLLRQIPRRTDLTLGIAQSTGQRLTVTQELESCLHSINGETQPRGTWSCNIQENRRVSV